MDRWFWIGLGGAAGTLARHGVSLWCQQRFGAGFPYGTLTVNVIGSFLLGVIMQIALTTELLPPTLRLALGTGVMGGFTTYSTFNYEALRFFQDRAWLAGAVYLGATVVGCLVAGVLGMAAARRLLTG
jgi:CrcB protein